MARVPLVAVVAVIGQNKLTIAVIGQRQVVGHDILYLPEDAGRKLNGGRRRVWPIILIRDVARARRGTVKEKPVVQIEGSPVRPPLLGHNSIDI